MEYALIAAGVVALAAVSTFAGLALKWRGVAASHEVAEVLATSAAEAAKAREDSQRLRADGAEAARASDVAKLERVVVEQRTTIASLEADLARVSDPAAVRADAHRLLSGASSPAAASGGGDAGGGALPGAAPASGRPG